MPKIKTAPKVISERVWHGRQSVECERIVSVHGKRVRYLIGVDSYDFQSSATAELWNGEKWHKVHSIPGQAMASCKTISYVEKGVTIARFAVDLAELERVTLAIIGES